MTYRDLSDLANALREFADVRDWNQFHSPRNLATALSVECAEVLEHFQWLTDEQSRELTVEQKRRVAMELADVLNYLVRLADVLQIDLLAAAHEKIKINAAKYPVDRARGSSKKYSDL
jgi:dCTP diphosphatase